MQNSSTLPPKVIEIWHKLVVEAEIESKVMLSENVESYLVFMLIRQTQQKYNFRDAVTLDLLGSMQKFGEQKEDNLRIMADKCILIAGLFPNQAKKHLVKVSYFIKVASAGYGLIADQLDQGEWRNTYQELHESANDMVYVLDHARDPLSRHYASYQDVIILSEKSMNKHKLQ